MAATSRHVVVQNWGSNTGTETIRERDVCGQVAHWSVQQQGKGVCHHIGDTRYMYHVPGALSNEGELSLLPGCPQLRDSVKAHQQQLVVNLQLELAALQRKPEVADGCKGGQQLPVESRILTLRSRQLLGEESQRLPASYLFLLGDASDVGVRGVSGQGELCVGEWVHQRCGSFKGGLDGLERLLQGGRLVQLIGVTFETLCQRLECAGICEQELGVEVDHLRYVFSLLVAHLAAVAATRVQFPSSCQILYIK